MEGNGSNNKIQLIHEDETFNERGMQALIRHSRELSSCGVDYSIISILGLQCSGKSTLVNHIFGTTFTVMNEEEGRSQTTKGIWMAEYINPCIIIFDIEGTDGRERAQEDTCFAKTSALFSLSVSDIIMINMWYQEIGPVNGASIPLLRLLFRERVRLHLPQRQTMLLVVVRDYNFRTKLEAARKQIGDILNEIWTTITKQDGQSNLKFSEYFKYDVVPIPHLQFQSVDFHQKAKELREMFSKRLVGQGPRIPISGLTMNFRQIWSIIQENEDLNIPSIRVMVSQHMCSQIVMEKLQSFQLDEVSKMLLQSYTKFLCSSDTTSTQEFLVQVGNLIDTCMNSYLQNTEHYDENARVTHERVLKSELFKRMQPEHEKMIKRLAAEVFESFKQEAHDIETVDINKPVDIFEQKCAEVTIAESNWNCAWVQNELLTDITKHVDFLVAESKIEREKLLLSKFKCFEIANEKFQSFKSSKGYESLLRDVTSDQVEDFTYRVKNLTGSCLQEYSMETSQYDEMFHGTNEEWLKNELYKLMKEPYRMLIKCKYQKCWTLYEESLKTADNLYNASVSALSRFKQECAEVTCAEFGWKYNKFVKRMKDDMRRKIDEIIEQEKRKAAEHQSQQAPLLDLLPLLNPGALVAEVIVGALAGVSHAAANAAWTAGQGSARLEAMENSYDQARSFLSLESDDLLDDDSEDEI